MRASDWLKTASGIEPLTTASTSVQPPTGQPGPGYPPTCRAPVVEHESLTWPVASEQVLPVASTCCAAVSVFDALKKPVCVGISWSSPWRIAEVECVAG